MSDFWNNMVKWIKVKYCKPKIHPIQYIVEYIYRHIIWDVDADNVVAMFFRNTNNTYVKDMCFKEINVEEQSLETKLKVISPFLDNELDNILITYPPFRLIIKTVENNIIRQEE